MDSVWIEADDKTYTPILFATEKPLQWLSKLIFIADKTFLEEGQPGPL